MPRGGRGLGQPTQKSGLPGEDGSVREGNGRLLASSKSSLVFLRRAAPRHWLPRSPSWSSRNAPAWPPHAPPPFLPCLVVLHIDCDAAAGGLREARDGPDGLLGLPGHRQRVDVVVVGHAHAWGHQKGEGGGRRGKKGGGPSSGGRSWGWAVGYPLDMDVGIRAHQGIARLLPRGRGAREGPDGVKRGRGRPRWCEARA
jgi:hypothetical protein